MKNLLKFLGIVALTAAIVLGCKGDPENGSPDIPPDDINGDNTEGQIPNIEWLGETRELGASWTVNTVETTRNPANGAFTYKLDNEDINDSFNVLRIKSSAAASRYKYSPLTIGHQNYSANARGVLFMYNHDEWKIDDNFPELDKYYPGILKVHETVFQKYVAFVLKIVYVGGDNIYYYLIKPQRGQLKNLEANDSYIFYIEEASIAGDDFGGATYQTDTNHIISVSIEAFIDKDKEVPDNPPVRPPEPPVFYDITYIAVDEAGNAIGANGIFTDTADDPAPTSVEKNSPFSFKIEVPENYELKSVKAGETTLSDSSGTYTHTPTGDVVITATFEYTPPPPDPDPFKIEYIAVNEYGVEIDKTGVFTGNGVSSAPTSVEQGESISFKVITPTDEVLVVELVEVKAGETSLTAAGGVYSFTPSGNVTVYAVIKKSLPPVDELEDYSPDEEDDPYGTAVIITPPEKTGNKFVIISTASNGGAEVDPSNTWKFANKPVKTYWNDLLKSNTKTYYDAMLKIKNSSGKTATWIWDRSDSWAYGVSGCFTVITASRFDIAKDENVVESTVPFYFACDNACAVYVNGKLAGYTTKPFADFKKNNKTIVRDKPGPTSEWRFTGLDNDDFDGTVFGYLYMVNIKPFLIKGHNEILVMAANNDDSGGRWNTTNNPAGLLFACEFSVK